MKTYLDESFIKQIKELRTYETSVNKKWGGKKRLFKCVDVQLEIKFCKAEMLLDESLKSQPAKKKIEMIEMMYRAWDALINKAEENGYIELDEGYKCYQFNKDQIAIICDSDLQLSNLKGKFGKDKDVVLFSMEELFRFVHPDYMDAKKIFKQRDMDITFKRVTYDRQGR
jgi:hypothetical protein